MSTFAQNMRFALPSLRRGWGRLWIVLLLSGLSGSEIQASCWLPNSCEEIRQCLNAPAYYCACQDALPFAYGLDTVLTEPTWYKGALSQLQEGITAYWFASKPVRVEVYPLCSSAEPLLGQTIRGNGGYSWTVDEIADKMALLEGFDFVQQMQVYIRVTPLDSTGGRCVMTSYTHGLHSTCANALPVIFHTPYVLSGEGDTYALSLARQPKALGVQGWNSNGAPIAVEMVLGQCEGQPVAQGVLRDSFHLWVPQPELLEQAYAQEQTVYFRFSAVEAGHIQFVSPLTWAHQVCDTTLCQGIGLELADTTLRISTLYADSVYQYGTDTVQVTDYRVAFTQPSVQYDTLRLEQSAFPYLYQGQGVISRYGDYVFTLHEPQSCDTQIRLSVEPLSTAVQETAQTLWHLPTTGRVGQQIAVQSEPKAEVKVYNLTGKLVWQRQVEGVATFVLPEAGLYICRLTTPTASAVSKISVK